MEHELEQAWQLELGKVYEQQLDTDDQLELEQQLEPIKFFNEKLKFILFKKKVPWLEMEHVYQLEQGMVVELEFQFF